MPNPYLAGLPWAGVTGVTGASGATYATGPAPWNGQLMNVQPASNFFTPSSPVPAEDLNYVLNQRDNALIYAQNRLGAYRLTSTGRILLGPLAGVGWGNHGAYNNTTTSSPGPVFIGNFGPVSTGDVVELYASINMNYVNTVSNAQMEFQFIENYSAQTTTVSDSSSEISLFSSVSPTTLYPGLSLIFSRFVVTGGTYGVWIEGKVGTPTANADWQIASGSLIYKTWSAN